MLARTVKHASKMNHMPGAPEAESTSGDVRLYPQLQSAVLSSLRNDIRDLTGVGKPVTVEQVLGHLSPVCSPYREEKLALAKHGRVV